MDDSVPSYEGNGGDANNHSETLNKTLDHAMLVRNAFTALSPRTGHTRNRVHYSPS